MVKIWTREEYEKVLWNRGFLWKDDCPFCDLEKKKDYTIWMGKYWALLHSKYSYTGDDRHIIAIPLVHKKLFVELDDNELLELKDVHNQVKEFFGEKNYFSCTRETLSDGTRDARSVEHMHIHFIPGKLQGKYLRKMLENQGFPIKEDKLEMKVCN